MTACWIGFVCASIFSGPFDAVLPLHLKRIFNFTAMTSGAVFAALAVPEIVLGPVAGWIVDHYGSKVTAFIGFTLLCPALFLLVIPTGPATAIQIIILVAILFFNGYPSVTSDFNNGNSCAMSMLGAPGTTEITLLLRDGGGSLQGNGYAQGYAWFNVAYSIGILFGPLLAGWLVEKWSWTVVCFVMGTLAGLTIIPVLFFTGGKSAEEKTEDTD